MHDSGYARPAAVLLLAGLVLPWLPARGEQPTGGLAQIHQRMQGYVDQGEIAGAVTVVGRHDAILSVDSVGLADAEHNHAMTETTVFRIASMTKPVTALAIMMLVDEGRLTVEDSVEKYLPEFRGQMLVSGRDKAAGTVTLKKPARPITIRDLLTHTSGLPFYPAGLSDLYKKRNRTLAEGILVVSQLPLEFEPGSRWAYCNTGIDTLGRIVEVVSGQPYEEFLRKRIFDPLFMHDTTFYPTPAQKDRLAVTYGKKDGRLVPAINTIIELPETGARFPVPAGGLYSTASDLTKLYQMMLNRGTRGNVRFVSETGIAAMTKLQTGELRTGFVEGMGWGFGWGVVRQPQVITEALSPGSYGHGGAFGTQAWIDPTKDLFTVLLIQRDGLGNSDGTQMRRDLQNLAAAAVKKN
jgi:CubicO group peptidase (beta-lactamase class C family)